MIISIIGGCLLRWLIFPIPYIIFLPIFIKILVLVVCFLGALYGFYLSNWSLYLIRKVIQKKYINFIGFIWFLPYLSANNLIFFPLLIRKNFLKTVDNGWSEQLGAQNLNNNLEKLRQFINLLQFNNLKIYLIYFFLWIIIFGLVLI